MTDTKNHAIEKIKVTTSKHWKKIIVVGGTGLLIGVAGIGGFHYYEHQEEKKEETARLTKALTSSGVLAKTYSQWHQVITKSNLSSSDKATFIKTIENNKSEIDKLATDKEKNQKAYDSILGTYETDYQKLITSHTDLWKKLDSTFNGFTELSNITSENITALKQDISSSQLSDADKKTLSADADKMLDLSDKWNAAYPKYSKEALALSSSMKKDAKTVLNILQSDKISLEEIAQTVGVQGHIGEHHRHNKDDKRGNEDMDHKMDLTKQQKTDHD